MLSNPHESVLEKSSQPNVESSDFAPDSLDRVDNRESTELDLNITENLKLYLENTKRVYEEIIDLNKGEKVAKFEGTDGDEKLKRLGIQIARLEEVVRECEKKALDSVEFITDEMVIELQELYDKTAELHTEVCEAYLLDDSIKKENVKKNATLKITSEDEVPEGNIEINVVKLAKEETATKQVESLIEEVDSNSSVDIKDIRFAPSLYAQMQPGDIHPVAETEKKDPINAIYNESVIEVAEMSREQENLSLSREYLNTDRYKDFIGAFYPSPDAFEKTLRLAVIEIESTTDSKLDNWLGVRFNSPFEFIQNMSISEVQELAGDDARSILDENGIKYETFLTWIDLIPDMQEIVSEDEQLLFGELFAKWIIESQMLEQAEAV